MKTLKILLLILCATSVAYKVSAKECFILSEHNKIIHRVGDCDERYSPCSTFKIPISLMGYDAGILTDEAHPTWDYQSGYVDWLERWKQPHNPKLWFTNSCVWYSQIITNKLGMQKFSGYTKQFNYGNYDVSGDAGLNNGLTNSWLSSSLLISPDEQINFLNKLIGNQLKASSAAHEYTKKIMYIETLENGWQLYGKTGSGYQLDGDGKKNKDRQVGWFVGFVQKEERSIAFTYLIVDEEKQDTYASLRAKEALKNNLTKFITNNSISHSNVILHDTVQDRVIPVTIYRNEPCATRDANVILPVVIINHGYGVNNTEYTFIANNLAAQGYLVASIQHDLSGDPDLPRLGDLYQLRMPFWERGVRSIGFTIDNISKDYPEFDVSKVILIGHSNGGDISMMFADKYPNKVKKVISLDSLRYPFPTNCDILSLRANDTSADNGVLTKNPDAKIIRMSNAKHIDMYDEGPNEVKGEIIHNINDFLRGS